MRFSHLACCLALFVASISVAQEPARIHRMKAGSAEVIALHDGYLVLQRSILKNIDAPTVNNLLGSDEAVPTTVNAFLIKLNGHIVLVDAGGRGQAYGGDLDHLAECLRSAGVKPESVEAVLLTHLHFDHMSGLTTPEGKRAFPNARLRLAQAEYDYFLNPALENSTIEYDRRRYSQAKAAFGPYMADGSVRPFAPGEVPFADVTAMPIPGHTPGHTVYAVGSGKDAVWFVGDIVHFGKLQFKHPEASVSFDTDSDQARARRLEILQKASQSGAVLAAGHLAFPGMGRVKVDGRGFDWIPVKQ